MKEKEDLTKKVLHFGLWQSISKITEKLKDLNQKEKVEALQSQLRFRQKVLGQVSTEKGIFSFSAKNAYGKYKKHSVARLQDNLIKLVTASVESAGDETETGVKLVGKRVFHRFSEGEWAGQVISVVPGFPELYNIRYDDDDSLYTYQLLEDYRAGDLRIVESEP